MDFIKHMLKNEDIRDFIDSNGCSEEFSAEDVLNIIKDKTEHGSALLLDAVLLKETVKAFNQELYFQFMVYPTKSDFESAKSHCASECYLFEHEAWANTDALELLHANYAVKLRSNDGETSTVITQDDYEYITAHDLSKSKFEARIGKNCVVVSRGKTSPTNRALKEAIEQGVESSYFEARFSGSKINHDDLIVFSEFPLHKSCLNYL